MSIGEFLFSGAGNFTLPHGSVSSSVRIEEEEETEEPEESIDAAKTQAEETEESIDAAETQTEETEESIDKVFARRNDLAKRRNLVRNTNR